MAKRRSVTSRNDKKKRNPKPWQEKMDEYCLKYLDMHREARSLMSKVAAPRDLASFVSSPNPANAVFEKHAELRETKSIFLTPEFVQTLGAASNLKALVQAGEHAYPVRIADALEIMQLMVTFDSLPPALKLNGYFLLSMWIGIGRDFLSTLRRMQFGAEPLDEAKTAQLAAQFFEILAQFCRGQVPPLKGRHNLELVDLVKTILEHQTEQISDQDLRKAVQAAGLTVPEGETWKIWVWRARKDGLIPSNKGPKRTKRKRN